MVKIRPMKLEDAKLALQWAADEGWNPGKQDALAYLAADPSGCFILELDNTPIASIMAISYTKEFAFIGLYIVRPEYRKQGYGKMLWEHAIRYLKDNACTGLYAVPSQVSNYKRSGFNSSFKILRWAGISKTNKINIEVSSDTILTDDSSKYIESMALYEQSIFKVKRTGFINSLIKMLGTCCIIALTPDLSIKGFIISRQCVDNSYRIGPLYANDLKTAEKLIEQSIKKIGENNNIFMDSPEPNSFSAELAEALNLKHINENDTFAMYKGPLPNIENDKVYALTSLELS